MRLLLDSTLAQHGVFPHMLTHQPVAVTKFHKMSYNYTLEQFSPLKVGPDQPDNLFQILNFLINFSFYLGYWIIQLNNAVQKYDLILFWCHKYIQKNISLILSNLYWMNPYKLLRHSLFFSFFLLFPLCVKICFEGGHEYLDASAASRAELVSKYLLLSKFFNKNYRQYRGKERGRREHSTSSFLSSALQSSFLVIVWSLKHSE